MHGFVSGFEFILRGGFMMYPLLISALIALTVIIERVYVFNKRYSSPPGFTGNVVGLLKAKETVKATSLCEKTRTPVSAVLSTGISHFDSPIEEMELAMKNEAEEWVPHLEKRIEILDTVITAAPLMGLLGTITGMMSSFKVMSEKGVNEPNAITGGVAEALIATATGLVIALLCLVAYNYLSSRIKIFIYNLESAGSRLVELRMSHKRKGL